MVAAEREVVAPVAPAAERLEVPVAPPPPAPPPPPPPPCANAAELMATAANSVRANIFLIDMWVFMLGYRYENRQPADCSRFGAERRLVTSGAKIARSRR